MLFALFLLMASAQASSSPPSYIGVWKYSGHDFSQVSFLKVLPASQGYQRGPSVQVSSSGSVRVSSYGSVSERITPRIESIGTSNPVIEELKLAGVESETCNILLHNQKYPLKVMMNRNAISAQYGDRVLRASLALKPDQVTFIEVVRTLPESLIHRRYGEVPPLSRRVDRGLDPRREELDRRNYYSSFVAHVIPDDEQYVGIMKQLSRKIQREEARNYYDLKTATVWLVSGQTPGSGYVLPLESAKLDQAIKRTDYPFVWELGRAAQTEVGDFKEAIKVALLQIRSELALLGGQPEDAYVFGHVLDKAHLKTYEKTLGMKLFSSYQSADEGFVVFSRVSELIKRLNLNEIMNGSKIQFNLVSNRLKELDGLTTERAGGRYRWRDFRGRVQIDSPAVTDLERLSYFEGACHPDLWGMDPLRKFRVEESGRIDGLSKRMRDYFSGGSWMVQDGSFLYDRTNYLRIRYRGLNAIVIDPPIDRIATVADWRETLYLAYRSLVDQKSGSASEHPAHFAFVFRRGVGVEEKRFLDEMKAKAEVIFFRPVRIQARSYTRFFSSTQVLDSGDGVTLYWVSFSDAESYLKKRIDPKTAERLDKILNVSSVADRFWGDPLPGT